MADPDINGFQKRLKKINKIHSRGGGFEAAGTLGQSYYAKAARRKRTGVLRPALLVVLLFVSFKAMLLAHQGPTDYYARLAELQAGSAGERFSAVMLAVDPVTEMLSVWFGHVVR